MSKDTVRPDISINRLIIKTYWGYCKPHKKALLMLVLMPVSSLLLNTFFPFVIGKTLATLSHDPAHADHYVPILIALALGGVSANYFGFKMLMTIQAKISAAIEESVFNSLLSRSVGFHNNTIAGKLISDAIQYPMAFLQLTNALLTDIVPFATGIVVGLVLIALNSTMIALLVLAMTAAVIATALYQTISLTNKRDERHAARRAMQSHLSDTLTNSTNVTIFASQARELQSFHHLDQKLMKLRTRDWTKVSADGSRRIAVLLSFEIAFVALIIHRVSANPSELGIGIFAFSYALSLGNQLFNIGALFRTVEDALLDATDMTRIITTESEVRDADDAADMRVSDGAIKFEAVQFSYPDDTTAKSVFSALNLNIEAHQKIGLVGPSGGGKSTLTRLLLRFEDIQSGSITIDGQAIAAVTQSSLRQAISYVPQEPLLFHRSIGDNIAYGKPGASDQEVREAAHKANALEFIEALPQGFNTIVGERGVKLSGGQRQRVAIARAILKDSPLLVLDEATSALDSESEAAIQSALQELMAGRTTLVIAHRLSTIQRLDRIVVLENGTVIEDGSHAALLAEKGLYSRLWQHQSGGFIED